jgi:predicted GH43/DUF377 family glycosyl hydrolase
MIKTVNAHIYLLVIILTLSIFGTDVIKAQKKSGSEDTLIIRHIASLRKNLTHIRAVSFQNIPVADQFKTAGIIEELLNRAEQKIFNLLPAGRFEWSWTGFDQPREMVAHAEELLNTLSTGKDPFAGKYAEPGGYVVDHALIKKDGLNHLFYIRGIAATNWPEYPLFNFGHAVSRDLKNWEIRQPVLQCPQTGWDQYQVWAPYIIESDGRYYMFYAGVNQNVCQAICLATSSDLSTWKRYDRNPVISSGPWGIWDTAKWSDCRDPMVFRDGNIFYCYYTAARKNIENGQPEYCLGISSSKDLFHWKDEGFIRLEYSLATPPESPFVFRHNGLYYLEYTNYKYGIVYLTSKDPVKGWKELSVEKMVLMGGVSASEIYPDGNKLYMSYISHQKNGLHFFEIRKLQWNRDGSLGVKNEK